MEADNKFIQEVIKNWRKCGKKSIFATTGQSMTPTIANGDKVIIQYMHPMNIGLGDIVLFKSSSNLVLHRVIGRLAVGGQLFFVEKGDATFDATLITAEDVIGKAVAIQKPNVKIPLEGKFCRLTNYGLAVCSLLLYLLYRGSRAVKRALLRHRLKRLTTLGSKGFVLVFALILKATQGCFRMMELHAWKSGQTCEPE